MAENRKVVRAGALEETWLGKEYPSRARARSRGRLALAGLLLLPATAHAKQAIVREGADDRSFHFFPGKDAQKRVER